MKSSLTGSLVLFLVVVFLSGLHGHWIASFFSLSLFLLLCFTALPLSKKLFPDKVEAQILALPVGFTVHAVGLSFVGLIFGIHFWSALCYVLLVLILSFYFQFRQLKRKSDSMTTQWSRSDFLQLYLWLFVTLAIVAVPFAKVGQETTDGFVYRAYFNADFFRNMAVAGSLLHTGIPPDNPYLGGYTLHYYWFFHLIDANWRVLFPFYRSDALMVQFSLVAILIFVSTFFVVLRRFIKHRKTVLFLLPVFAFGGSYEGIYVLQWLKNRGQKWTEFVNLNIDGILRWNWKAPQIDTLYRALLYAPQHLIALTIFLIALLIWNSDRLKEDPLRCNTRRTIFYFLIFSSLGFSAFIGATMIAGAALILLLQTWMEPQKKWRELILSGTLGCVFLFVYLYLFEMFQTGGHQLDIGPDRIILAHFPAYFLLNWGALLILGIAGLFFRSSMFPNKILFFFLTGCFLMIFFFRILLAGFSDISLKVGHFSHVLLLLLAGGFIDALLNRYPHKAKWIFTCVFLLVIPAFITWAMDAWNSSDIKNRRFTTYFKREDAEVCRWMRSNLPGKTLVLNYSPRYDDFMEDFIPAFAERSVFLGNRIFSRIFQVPEQDVVDRTKTFSTFVRLRSGQESWMLAREFGIEYVFVNGMEIQRMSELLQKLGQPYFSLVMQEGGSGLFRVNPQVKEQ